MAVAKKASIDMVFLTVILLFFTYQLYHIFLPYEDIFSHPYEYYKQVFGKDVISIAGTRFEEARKQIPTDGTIMCVGEDNEDYYDGVFNYIMMQYYLSPNLIVRTSDNVPDATYILYNLYNTQKFDVNRNSYLQRGWHVEKDFNNGLVLLAR